MATGMNAARILTTVTLVFGTLTIATLAGVGGTMITKGIGTATFSGEIITFVVMIAVAVATRRQVPASTAYYLVPFLLSALFIIWDGIPHRRATPRPPPRPPQGAGLEREVGPAPTTPLPAREGAGPAIPLPSAASPSG